MLLAQEYDSVLITADHETGGLRPDENGNLAYSTGDHTLDDVPVFAWGCGLEGLNGETVENIEIAKLFAHLLGNDTFGDQSNDWYDEIYGESEE
jgi:alkaline phosphatase